VNRRRAAEFRSRAEHAFPSSFLTRGHDRVSGLVKPVISGRSLMQSVRPVKRQIRLLGRTVMQNIRWEAVGTLLGLAIAIVAIVIPYSWPDGLPAQLRYTLWIGFALCVLTVVVLVLRDLWRVFSINAADLSLKAFGRFVTGLANEKRRPTALSDIASPEPILHAIFEFDQLGRKRFLQKYGFGKAKSYWLVHNGKRYDSKAILGAAHGYARPDLGPARSTDFGGGEATVKRKLEDLGFTITSDA